VSEPRASGSDPVSDEELDPEQVRRTLSALDARRQKIVVGLFTLMIRTPERAREREWMAEQLASVTVMAGEFEADTPHDAVRAVQDYLARHADELLRCGYLLFHRVGLDLAPRASEGLTHEDALRAGLAYLVP
jgi:hypothetical protein